MEIDSEDDLAAAVARIDGATAHLVDALDAKTALGVTDADIPFLKAVDWALTYYATEGVGRKRFGPLSTIGGLIVPPSLDAIPDEIVRDWERLSFVVTSDVVRARLHELCALKGSGDAREHDRAAVEAHIEIARRPLPKPEVEPDFERIKAALDRVDSINIAVRLSAYRHLDDLCSEAMVLAVQLADDSLEDPTLGPGAVLGLVRSVVDQPTAPSSVDSFLVRARAVYASDIFNTASVIGLQQARASTSEARALLHRSHIQALFDAAATSEPISAMMHLRDAAEIASTSSQSDLLTEATRRLQAIGVDDLGLTKRETKFSFPRVAVDSWIEFMLSSGSWESALDSLLTNGPPTGRFEENEPMAADLPRQAPLSTSFPTTLIDRRGRPVATFEGDDPQHLLVKVEMERLAILAPIHGLALRRILERWAPFKLNESLEFFRAGAWVSDEIAQAARRAFNRCLRDPESAAITALPLVERVIRDYLLALSRPVWTPPLSGRMGEYLSLAVLVSELEHVGVDPSWRRFLRTTLSSRPGLNLRNDLLHGERVAPNETEASLALLAVAYVCRRLPPLSGGGAS